MNKTMRIYVSEGTQFNIVTMMILPHMQPSEKLGGGIDVFKYANKKWNKETLAQYGEETCMNEFCSLIKCAVSILQAEKKNIELLKDET